MDEKAKSCAEDRWSLHQCVVRYYLSAKALSTPVTHKTHVLLQVYQTLQFLPLFISDSQQTEGLPWDFENFWWLWNGISIFTRLERAMRLLALSPIIFLATSCILTGLRLACVLFLLLDAALMSRIQFDVRMTRSRYGPFTKFLYKVDRWIRALVSTCFPITLLSFYTSLTFCVLDTCDSGLTLLVYRVLGAVSLAATIVLMVCDRTYLSTLDWAENQCGSISSPWYSAVFVWLDICITVVSTAVGFTNHSVLHTVLLGLFSIIRVCTVYMYLPYHHQLINCFESSRGLLVLWGITLYSVGIMYDSGGLMPTFSLLLITPMILYLNTLCMKKMQVLYCHPKRITSAYQLEFLMRNELSEKLELHTRRQVLRERTRKETNVHARSSKVEEVVERFEREIYRDTVMLIWMLYFYRIQQDCNYIKVLRADLCKQSHNAINKVAALHCFYSLEKWLLQLPNENEVVDFLSYQNDIEEVMECDYQATKVLKDLLEEMGKKHSSFTRTVQLSHQLSFWMNRTLSTYKTILATHSKSLDVLKLFISFLQLIGQPSTHYENQQQKLEVVDSKRKIPKTISMNEPGNVTFVVSLESRDFGMIRWARAVEKLDYRPGELIGSSHLVLVPEPIRRRHTGILKNGRIRTVNDHGAFAGSHLVYMCNRKGDLVLGKWIIRLANERPDGDLVIVASIQICEHYEDLAFVDISTQNLTSMTTVFKKALTDAKLEGSSLHSLFNMRLTQSDFRSSKSVLKLAPNMEVRADILRIFGSYEQPVLKIFREKEESIAPAPSEADLSRAYTPRGVRFDEYGVGDNEGSKMKEDRALSSLTGSDTKSSVFATRLAEFHRASSRHSKLFALTLLIIVLMSVATPSLIVALVTKSTADLDERVSEINNIGLRRLFAVSAALNSRELMLHTAKYGDFWNETRAREQLRTVATMMQEMRNSLQNSMSGTSGHYREFLLRSSVPFWEWTGRDFQFYEITLVNLMSKFSHSASVLNASSLITSETPDFLNLFRNGPFEALHIFNRTLNLYIEDSHNAWEENENLLQWLVYVSMSLLCALALCAVVPVIILSERKRKQIWASLLSFSSKEISTLRFNASERLIETHGLDDAKNVSAVENDGSSTRYQMSGTMKLLVSAIALYMSCVCIVLFLIYSIGAGGPSNLLLEKPYYMHWSGYRRSITELSRFWLREIWLESSQVSYFTTIRKHGGGLSPTEEWRKTLSELIIVNAGLSYGSAQMHLNAFAPTNSQKDFLHGDACVDCASSSQKGLAPLIFEIGDAEYVAVECLHDGGSYRDCGGLQVENLITSALPLIEDSLNQFDGDSSEEIDGYVSLVRAFTIAFTIFSVFVYTLIFFPLIRKNAQHWREEMNVMNFLPKDKIVDVLITSARPGNEDGSMSKRN